MFSALPLLVGHQGGVAACRKLIPTILKNLPSKMTCLVHDALVEID